MLANNKKIAASGTHAGGRLLCLLLLPLLGLAALAPLRSLMAEIDLHLAENDSARASPARLQNLQAALVLFPNNADTLQRMAEVQMQTGQPGLAAASYRKAAQIRPTWPFARVGLITARLNAGPAGKLPDEQLSQLARLGPGEPNIQIFLAWLQVNFGGRLGAQGLAASDAAVQYLFKFQGPEVLRLVIEHGDEAPLCQRHRSHAQFALWCAQRKHARQVCVLRAGSPEAQQGCQSLNLLPAATPGNP